MKLTNDKPPLGLRPVKIARQARIDEITDALYRYAEKGAAIPREWIEELQALIGADRNDHKLI